MRLLHTISLNLVEFIEDIPRARYAILSHTWGEDEVSFRDLTYDIERSKKGWRKITNACEYAASRGWEYIWIDTCCIDKSDPTELSLAINSMFRWYEASGVCYAYLSDVMSPATVSNRSRVSWFRADEFDAFSRSRWFRRGWTLQELLAPDVLEFLYEDWTPIASREDMASEMQKGTGITSDHLANFRMCSLATKLSWAANRETTRVEDRSYSLLGLLGVHMPLIYGEGENAFVRLQHELIRKYNDESIFVWDGEIGTERGVPVGELRSGSCLFPVLTSNPQRVADESLSPTTLRIRSKILQVDNENASFPTSLTRSVVELEVDPSTHTSILAPSPRSFMSATQFGLQTYRHDKTRFRFEMTNSGLSINAELYRNVQFFAFPAYMIPLNCSYVHQKVKPGFPRRVSSPMVLLLSEAYPDESEMYDYVDGLTISHGPRTPTMFRKIPHGPMDWKELDPGRTQWVSLGRQNIIILNEVDDSGGLTSLDYFGDVKFVFDPPSIK